MATIIGGPGADTEIGTSTSDLMALGGGDDAGFGLQGNDVLRGQAGDDLLSGGDGRDRLLGGGGIDTLFGDSGRDVLHGDNADDRLYGGGGNDLLRGGNGDDRLFGRSGDDELDGGAGNDVLEAGPGSNTLIGGDGEDGFVFRSTAPVPGGLTLAEFADELAALDVLDPAAVQQFVDDVLAGAEDVDVIVDSVATEDISVDPGLPVAASSVFLLLEAAIGGSSGVNDALLGIGFAEGPDFTGDSFFKLIVLQDMVAPGA